MFVVILLTSLISIILFAISSITYFVILIHGTSDGDLSDDTLTIGSHDANGSPPKPLTDHQNIHCDRIDHHHHHSDNNDHKTTEVSPSKSLLESNANIDPLLGPLDLFSEQRLAKIAKEPVQNNNLPIDRQETVVKNLQASDQLVSSKRDSKNDSQSIKQLYDDFDQRDVKFGGTGLHWCKNRRSVDKLLKLGIPINSLNNRKETALHVAVRRRKLQVLIGLLCHGADIECKNVAGETPLLLACKVTDMYACQLLIVFDANVNATDDRGFSARHYAAGICSQYMKKDQLPCAAHIILATLHEMDAKRCTEIVETGSTAKDTKTCAEGCSSAGAFNGNSYERWPNYEKESLYKRHLFDDIVEEKRRQNKDNLNSGEIKRSRILCIDGGGMRGVIVCQTMIELEKYLKKPLIEYFDWIGGTSVGAFLSCALCTGTTLLDLRRICFDVKDEVFYGNKPYNPSFLERVLKRTYGSTTRMSKVRNKKLAVTTVIADRDPCQLIFFRNYKSPRRLLEKYGYSPDKYNIVSSHSYVVPHQASPNRVSSKPPTKSNQNLKDKNEPNSSEKMLNEHEKDPLMWQAVRASAAAPFFFKPYGPYLDGGIISNNPTLDMLTEFHNHERVKTFLRKRGAKSKTGKTIEPASKLDLVVSFGTGRGRVIGKQAMIDVSKVSASFAAVFSPVELVRSIRAVRELFKKIMQQSCQTEDHIIDRAQAWCSSLEIPYYRINPSLASIFSIDDKRDEQLINALWQTKLYMKSMRTQLATLAEIMED